MPNRFRSKFSGWCALGGLLAPILAASAQAQPAEADTGGYFRTDRTFVRAWPRNFRVGMLVGLNITADFRITGPLGISGSSPGPAGESGADHFYDDGYVLVDQTQNAQGYTSFWGYDDASQYDPDANTLTMHSSRAFAVNAGSRSVSDGPFVGFDLAYGGHLLLRKGALIGWELGFGLLPINLKDDRSLAGLATRTVHTFDTTGLIMPTAPYRGGDSGLGPTLRDVATAQPDGDPSMGTLTGSRELDLTLYIIRLGPTFYWEIRPPFSLQLGIGAAVGVVSGDYKFNETLVLDDGGRTANAGKFDASALTYGGYVNAVLRYQTVEHGDLYVSAQYMPLSGTTAKGAGREARLDLSGGVYLAVGINWPF